MEAAVEGRLVGDIPLDSQTFSPPFILLLEKFRSKYVSRPGPSMTYQSTY